MPSFTSLKEPEVDRPDKAWSRCEASDLRGEKPEMDRAEYLIKRAVYDARLAATLLLLRRAQEVSDRLAAERIYEELETIVPSRGPTGTRLYNRVDATIASRVMRDPH